MIRQETTERELAIEYIAAMATETARIAQANALEALAYVLGMAVVECGNLSPALFMEAAKQKRHAASRSVSPDPAGPASAANG